MNHVLAEDTIDASDLLRLIDWLKGNPHLTKGGLTLEFEKKWNRWLGSSHAVFCNSGSSSLLLMFAALALEKTLPNRTAIVPAAGWGTTVSSALWTGFEPVLCDADPDTYGLDLNHLESLLREKSPAVVLATHVLGVPHKMKELLALKERYGFILLEDACAAAGSSYGGRKVGTFGDMAAFSFYFGHQMSTIEGGMVVAKDTSCAGLLRVLRSHGWTRDLEGEAGPPADDGAGHGAFLFEHAGFNVKSTDLNAFLGIRQLDKIDKVVERRRENHAIYAERLSERFGIQHPPEGSVVSGLHFAVIARDRAERDAVLKELHRKEVEARSFAAGNVGRHPFWVRRFGECRLPMADRLFESGFFLPNHPSLTPDQARSVAAAVLAAAPAA